MRVDDSIALLTAVSSTRVQNVIQAWRVGQVLEAVVERITNVGNTTLNVNQQSIDVRTAQPLAVGTKLALEVAQTGAQTVLRVLKTTPPREPVTDTIRALLPRQAPLGPTLARLASWVNAADATASSGPGTQTPPPNVNLPSATAPALSPARMPVPNAPIPQPVLDLARKILDRLPTPRQVQSPEQLRAAVQNAGPFFERKLAAGQLPAELDATLDGDLKAGLLRLVALVRTFNPPPPPGAITPRVDESAPQSPPRAAPQPSPVTAPRLDSAFVELRAVEDDARSALARVTLHQLASLPRDESAAPQWLLDIPVRNGERIDLFHLHVFREKKPRDPKFPPAWCVRLSFDLTTLGAIDVLVTYHAMAISVSMWAKRRATVTLFEHHLETLRAQLRADGVTVNHMHCELGSAPFAHDPVHALKHHSLIDEHA